MCHWFQFGVDQLQSCFGDCDNEVWAKKFKNLLMAPQLKKITLFDMSPALSSLKGTDKETEVNKIFGSVSRNRSSKEFFGVFLRYTHF